MIPVVQKYRTQLTFFLFCILIQRRKWKYLFIYKTTNLITKKIYVGKCSTEVVENGYLGSGKHFLYSLNFYGKENFQREIIEFCRSQSHLNRREVFWIEKLDARNPLIGYNIGRGGNCPNIEYHTEESKQKISEAGKNRTVFEETRNRQHRTRERHSYTHTEETKKKLSLSHIGKKQSEETKRRRKETLKNKLLETCEWCNYQGQGNIVKRWHGDNCNQNPNRTITKKELKKRVRSNEKRKETLKNKLVQVCPYCGFESRNIGTMKGFHFENCRQSPNYVPKPNIRKLLICPHCGKQGRGGCMKQWHFDNCKYKQKVA